MSDNLEILIILLCANGLVLVVGVGTGVLLGLRLAWNTLVNWADKGKTKSQLSARQFLIDWTDKDNE